MAVCPQCQFANREPASACGRCGFRLVGTTESGLMLPLPSRMIEPIRPPSKPVLDCLPVDGMESHLVAATPAPLESSLSSSPAPSLTTLRDPPADAFPTHDANSPGGTVPAQPGLLEQPMNDAVLQTESNAAPTTQPAEEPARAVQVVPAGRPKLLVLRGLKINAEYPIYEGRNTIGRFADKPVDIDLVSQESVEQIWCSRQHAVITFERGNLIVEDLNSLNGTWVNGSRIHAGQFHMLKHGDVLQIGTVQMKLLFG